MHLVEGPHSAAAPGPIDHISFRCNEVASVIVKLEEHRVEYQISHVPVLGDTQLFFRDPLGLGVELTVVNLRR